jgi:(S)-ureidoglycine aminohydrolase
MNDLFGFTRNVLKQRYALLTPGGFVHGFLPGWQKAVCNVLISPAMGARFSQILITLEQDGECQGNTGNNQYFIYLVEGAAGILIDERRHRLDPGSYVYLPLNKDVRIRNSGAGTKILIFQKRYHPLAGMTAPESMVGQARDVKGAPFMSNEAAQLQVLLPNEPAFDMAVNIFTYQPGATLPFVETHVMEHGLMMLSGQGIYRLDSDWHPVRAGDVIWIAPYCPQWFVAMGKEPASYIYYQDVNRDPS